MHKTVLFDLDGTLIDQFIAIHKSVNYVQKQLHLKESAFEEVKAAVGGSIRLTLDRLFNSHSLEETHPYLGNTLRVLCSKMYFSCQV